MLSDINAVLFDLDGTLVDSMWMWKEIDIEFLSQFQITLPDGLQDAIEGMSFTETAMYFKEQFQLPISVEETKQIWNHMAYDKYVNHVPLKKGALEFLEYLKEHDIKAGIATSNSRHLVEAVTDSLNIKQYFHSIRTSCEVNKGKPSPDIYLKVADDLNIKPKHCLVFEDLPAGLQAGKNANMKTCAIFDEFSKDLMLQKKALADYYIETYNDIFTKHFEIFV